MINELWKNPFHVEFILCQVGKYCFLVNAVEKNRIHKRSYVHRRVNFHVCVPWTAVYAILMRKKNILFKSLAPLSFAFQLGKQIDLPLYWFWKSIDSQQVSISTHRVYVNVINVNCYPSVSQQIKWPFLLHWKLCVHCSCSSDNLTIHFNICFCIWLISRCFCNNDRL